MKKMTGMLNVLVAVFTLASGAAWADGTPSSNPKAPTPAPGGYPAKYRLMFATEAGYDADQTDINWYNTQVNNAANNLGGETGSTVADLGVTWRCVGSSSNVSARVNSKTLRPNDPGYDANWDLPIYNFSGELLAANNAKMWDGSLLEPGYDSNQLWDEWSYENGVEPNNIAPVDGGTLYQSVWTGTGTGGDIYPNRYLGHTNKVQAARAERLWSGDWISWGSGIGPTTPRAETEWQNSKLHLYGLSDPITAPVYTWYTLTFDPQGGTNLSETNRLVTGINETYGFRGPLPTVTAPAGFVFWAWYEDAAATGPAITESTPLVLSADKTVYAGYEVAYTLTFDGRGGTPSEASRQVTALDGTYGFRGPLPTVTPPAGQIFCGWFEDAAATGPEIREWTPLVISADKTIYAKVQPLWDGPSEPLVTNGLLGYWSFNKATAEDFSGNDYHGTESGSLNYSSNDIPHGFGGASINLTGGGSVGVSTGGSEDIFDVQAHSIAFWTKRAPAGDWGNWITKTSEGDGFMIRQHGATKTTMYYDIRGGGGDLALAIDHNNDHWWHYVLTYDSSGANSGTKKIYRNGVEVASATNGKDPPPSIRTLAFGDRDGNDAAGYQASGGGNAIKVQLDEIYFFNRALTPEEVLILFTQPAVPAPPGTLFLIR